MARRMDNVLLNPIKRQMRSSIKAVFIKIIWIKCLRKGKEVVVTEMVTPILSQNQGRKLMRKIMGRVRNCICRSLVSKVWILIIRRRFTAIRLWCRGRLMSRSMAILRVGLGLRRRGTCQIFGKGLSRSRWNWALIFRSTRDKMLRAILCLFFGFLGPIPTCHQKVRFSCSMASLPQPTAG